MPYQNGASSLLRKAQPAPIHGVRGKYHMPWPNCRAGTLTQDNLARPPLLVAGIGMSIGATLRRVNHYSSTEPCVYSGPSAACR
jgi:hypothetical protein